jgi:hypothetical protein
MSKPIRDDFFGAISCAIPTFRFLIELAKILRIELLLYESYSVLSVRPSANLNYRSKKVSKTMAIRLMLLKVLLIVDIDDGIIY